MWDVGMRNGEGTWSDCRWSNGEGTMPQTFIPFWAEFLTISSVKCDEGYVEVGALGLFWCPKLLRERRVKWAGNSENTEGRKLIWGNWVLPECDISWSASRHYLRGRKSPKLTSQSFWNVLALNRTKFYGLLMDQQLFSNPATILTNEWQPTRRSKK